MDNIKHFREVVPYFTYPLVLVGIITLSFFGDLEALIEYEIIPRVNQ
jgi:hypothetical protein